MARIRTIKPEFWDSPSTARASAVARLAFIGMWNWADDFGRGTANMKELEGFIFPNDDIKELSGGISAHFRSVAAEVSDCFGVLFYTVAGRPYYAIPTWEVHQRNEKRAKSKYPGPDESDPEESHINTGNFEETRNLRDSAAEVLGSSVTGTGEQGNRGTGEQTKNTCSPTPSPSVRFPEFWAAYPRKTGKRTAATKFEAAAKRASADAVIDGALRLAQDPNLPETQYIPHPTTWLARDGWEDEPLPPKFTTGSDQRLARGYQMTQNLAQYEPPSNEFPEIEPDDYQRELEQ